MLCLHIDREVCASEGVCGGIAGKGRDGSGIAGKGRDGSGESRSSGREEIQETANTRVVVLVSQTMSFYTNRMKKRGKTKIENRGLSRTHDKSESDDQNLTKQTKE